MSYALWLAASSALPSESAIGLLLPCDVVVAQDGADAPIAAASPTSMFSVVADRAIETA